VERGDELEQVWMTLQSGDVIMGTPRPSREFVYGTLIAVREHYWQQRDVASKE